eukprot:gene5491-5726_t
MSCSSVVPCWFAGGSLAKLNMVLYQLHRRHRGGERRPSCYTFGSPPVLAHQQGGGGHRVLQELGLPLEAVKDFVLENDPIPRALLSVDPTFELLKGWSPVQGLLHLREALAGRGSPLSPNRFLFESVGQVHLIKWTQEGPGCQPGGWLLVTPMMLKGPVVSQVARRSFH